jgi:hypothetical protein
MQLSHRCMAGSAVFDEPNLVSSAGLVPVLVLAESAGLGMLAEQHLTVPTDKGANAGWKVTSLVGGMVAGRTRSMACGCCGTAGWVGCSLGPIPPRHWARFCVRSASATSGSWTLSPPGSWPGWRLGRRCWPALARCWSMSTTPSSRSTATPRRAAGFGYLKVRGLNALLATAASAESAPVVVAQRLRRGAANSARGAERLVADALKTLWLG